MRPTIYSVAEKAGVSIATVSKVINKTGRISDKTRRRIIDIMDEIGYRPSVVASALTGKNTYTIGLLIPDLANPFFAEIARSAEDCGRELGFNLVICSTDNDSGKESDYISLLRQKRVDGIIVATGTANEQLLKSLSKEKLPLALIARDMPRVAADVVLVDDFKGGYAATKHLLELGHEKIAIIAEHLHVVSSSERVRGYRAALEEHGIVGDERLVQISDFTIEDGKRVSAALLDDLAPPTAIFACNDLLAIGAIQAARARGLSVPGDLSVVGFDNTILATIVEPPLTTVAQPIREMGRQVMELLVQEIGGKKSGKRRIVLQPELVRRQSSGRPRQAER